MAWLYRQSRSKNWWIGYRVGGRQLLRSTGTSDIEEARRHLARVRTMFEANRAASLTQELFHALTGKSLPAVTLYESLNDWLEECKVTTAGRTHERYESTVRQFREHLKATETAPMLREVTAEQVRQFLASKRTKVKASTVNLDRRILRMFFNRAVENELLKANPMLPVKRFAAGPDEEVERRNFTLEQINLLYAKAPDDFWRYMILGEFHTGLRLGDLVCLRWGPVDFEDKMIRVIPRKTKRKGKLLHIPLTPQFEKLLWKLRGRTLRKPTAFIWPKRAAEYLRKGPGGFSNEFYELCLVPAGLATARESKKATKKGRAARRDSTALSFHCLRHSFVTLLKVAGGNQAVAKELAGHSSDIVSDLYTHLPAETLREAITRLPEIAIA